MKTLQQWAEIYKKLRIWIRPYKERYDSFYKEWKPIKTEDEYQDFFDQIDWNVEKGIELIAGKKGGIVICFHKDEESNYSKQSLLKVLSILGLPNDYDWVIESDYIFGIVLDVHSLPSGRINKNYRDFRLYWEDFYPLPPGTSECKYWFTYGLPRQHPESMAWNVFVEKLQEIDKHHLLVDDTVRAERRKREIVGKSIASILLVVVIGVITGIIATFNSQSFEVWCGMFLVLLGAACGLIYIMSH